MWEISVNPACFRWGTSLPEFVRACRLAGFAAVEVSIQQAVSLAKELGGIGALERWRESEQVVVTQFSGILPSGPVLPAPLLMAEPDFRAAVASVHQRLEAAGALGCRRAAVVVNPRSGHPRDVAADIALHRLGILSDAAAGYGIRLAVEYIGVTRGLGPDLTGAFPFIENLEDVDRLVAQCGRRNVGLLLDFCHLYASRELAAGIAQCASRIEFVQVSDVPEGVSPDSMDDSQRCLPGTGVLDLSSVIAELSAVGYRGPLSMSFFKVGFPKSPPAQG